MNDFDTELTGDGDAMGLALATDQKMVNLLEPLKPYKSAFDINKHRSLTNNISISKPVIAMQVMAFKSGDHGYADSRMDELLAA